MARVPAYIKVVFAGLVAGLLGTGSWAWLIGTNLTYAPRFPWAVPAMAVVLCAWWLYFARGRGWPAATGEARRREARANSVPEDLWGPALGTGLLGLIGILLLQGVLGRLVTLPQQQELDPSQYPLATVFAWVVMSSLVAGIVEETSFRGYIQGGLEQGHGPWIAILVTGSLFGLAHFSHPEVGIVLLPYYIAVAAVYGGLAYATNSTLPSMMLHAGGNMFSAFSLFTQGRSEWQLSSSPSALVWKSGVDASFVMNLVALAVVSALAFMAYRGLVKAGRQALLKAN